MRTQLVEAERALADPASVSEPSDLVALLLDAGEDERRERRQRLRDALGAFDGATIATTHQFCHLVLRSLGVAGDTDSGARLVEDLDDLLAEVVDDLYLRRFGDVDGEPLLSHAEALRLARSATEDPQAVLQPDLEQLDADGLPGLRVAFADGGARGARPAQATARRAQLRRPALPARRRAGRRHRAGPRTDAAALAGRARRRVPGHRPGAVAGPRPGVQRPRDDGADRRPEAGDLRVPRWRRRDVPPRGGDRHHPQDARHQPAQRRGAARLAAGGPPRCRPGRRRDRGARRARAPPGEPARRRRPAVPAAGGAPPDPRLPAGPHPAGADDPRPRARSTWRATSCGCSPPVRRTTVASWSRATSRSSPSGTTTCAPCSGRSSSSACPPSSPAAAASSRHRLPPSGYGCSRRSSSRTARRGSAARR